MLVGGPPCQGFSRIGKKSAGDVRNSLFGHFCRLVSETKPKAFLIENVPGVLDDEHAEVLKKAFGSISSHYRVLEPMIVNAYDFMAPTVRRRVFFVGISKEFPSDDEVLYERVFSKLHTAPVVKDALDGIPGNIDPAWEHSSGYLKVKPTLSGEFFDRVTNSIPAGVGDEVTVGRYVATGEAGNNFGTLHSAEIAARYDMLEFGQRDPITRSTRLDPKGYCPTLRAGTPRERGSFQAVRPIHFNQPRVITPREAARLQGFPDWFYLDKTKWHAFRHIGNSVSPLVAENILTAIHEHAFR